MRVLAFYRFSVQNVLNDDFQYLFGKQERYKSGVNFFLSFKDKDNVRRSSFNTLQKKKNNISKHRKKIQLKGKNGRKSQMNEKSLRGDATPICIYK